MIVRPGKIISSASYIVHVYQSAPLPALLFLFLCLLPSCSNPDTPETVAADFIDRCESIFENRELRTLNKMISERYHDQQGRSKQDIKAIAAAYVFRNRNIHILTRVKSAVKNDGLINTTILAAIAATPISDSSLLPDLNADMYWFDVSLVEEKGEWLVLALSWRQAMLDDFLDK